VFGWSLTLTIVCTGAVCVAYTVAGGSDAVRLTQQWQMGVIFVAMILAAGFLIHQLPSGLGWGDTLALSGGFNRLKAVDFSLDPSHVLHQRYTFWSGTLGGFFLALSYFGTDQSQVQRYLSAKSLRESRLGLMFHGVCKIPMQFLILSLGVLLFVFYQFHAPPVLFARQSRDRIEAYAPPGKMQAIETGYAAAQGDEARQLQVWLAARHAGDAPGTAAAWTAVEAAHARGDAARQDAAKLLESTHPTTTASEADNVFITFILDYLPHGLIGLLVAAFFAAALNSKAAELNALGSCATVDFYRHLRPGGRGDAHGVVASKWFTAGWGVFAIVTAVYAHLVENIVQAANIVGSLFYGAVLGLFLLAFFTRHVRGNAAFLGAVAAQILVLELYWTLDISYLWYNLIGPLACVTFALLIQAAHDRDPAAGAARPVPA
jgi:Na+/proline symporter